MPKAHIRPHNHEINVIIDEEGWKSQSLDFEQLIPSIVEHVLKAELISEFVELNVRLTNNHVMQQLNRDFRQQDKPTNVLSFPSDTEEPSYFIEEAGQWNLGDVAFGYEIIAKEAGEQGKTFKNHFIHLLVHGTLHLLGFDHLTDEEAEEMESLEIQLLEKLGISNPYLDQRPDCQ